MGGEGSPEAGAAKGPLYDPGRPLPRGPRSPCKGACSVSGSAGCSAGASPPGRRRRGGLPEARGIREAVMRLGPETAWQIALTAALLAVAEQDVRSLEGYLRDSWHEQWSHAMVVAATAGWLAVTYGRGDVERLFLAGLL